jgi:OOP family OmpA-OmpF porin
MTRTTSSRNPPTMLLVLALAAAGAPAAAQQQAEGGGAVAEPAAGGAPAPVSETYIECWKLKNWVDEKGYCAAASATDADGDGVPDSTDRCPGTAPGVAVDAQGCPLDGDGDGVADADDRCPGTPPGAPVDAAGCQKDHTLVIGNVEFAFDSDRIEPAFARRLDQEIPHLRSNPKILTILIEGYTDSTGPEAYNQQLSERRALAVRDYLVGQGVEASKLSAVGRGQANPAASNATPAGRAKNRRVELIVDVR